MRHLASMFLASLACIFLSDGCNGGLKKAAADTVDVKELPAEVVELQASFDSLATAFPGEVGIALITPARDTVVVNAGESFPLFSVVKFHQALAVCDALRGGVCPAATNAVKVSAADLKPDTWSPMREKYTQGGLFSPEQLMQYTLEMSDNNACDILFDNVASPAAVNDFIHGLGITDCGIAWTEYDQHNDPSRCYENWSTPLAAAQLLGRFYESRDLDEHSRFVWETMANCRTGAARIPKYIADSCQAIVHKTGTGGPLPDSKAMGINDIACVVLPDGSHFELAVFIKNAAASPAECEELIAIIAREVFEKL